MEQSKSPQDNGGGSKKGPIDSLSKEDLVKKCKGLLVIAQKAKASKDEFAEENKKLKEELNKYINQKEADKKSLKAMQEVVEALTEAKLTLSTKLSDVENDKNKLEAEIKSFTQCRQELLDLTIQNEALKRQTDRLTKENEELLVDLDNMEKKLEQVNMFGKQQQKDLVLLEKETEKWKTLEQDYNDVKVRLETVTKEKDALKEENTSLQTIKTHLDEAKHLRSTLESSESIIHNLRADKIEMTEEINELKQKLDYQEKNCTVSCVSKVALDKLSADMEQLKASEEKNMEKMQFFKTKLLECASKLKKLKNCRNALIATVQEYSQLVPKWQEDLIEASKVISMQFNKFEEDKKKWMGKIRAYEQEIESLRQNTMVPEAFLSNCLDKLQHVVDLCDKVKAEYNEKCQEVDSLKITVTENDCSKNELIDLCDRTKREDEEKCVQIDNLSQQISTLQNDLCSKDQVNQKLVEETEKLSNMRDEYETKLKETEERLKELQQSLDERKIDESESSEINSQLADIQSKNETYVNRIEKLEKQLNHFTEERDKILIADKEKDSQIQSMLDNMQELQAKLVTLEEENSKLGDDLEVMCEESAKQKEEHGVEMNKLKSESENLLKQLDQSTSTIQELQSSLNLRESESSDLLSEMRELNEALKARGDVISRQQDKIKELEAEMTQASEKLSKMEINLSEKETIINEKESEITQMTQGMLRAEGNQKTIPEQQQDVQSEVASVSTISRVEESARMKELDDSYEEKYNKLKLLAVKMKKKVQEQATYISRIESENKKNFEEKNEINIKLGTINVQVKNLQALQNENDKLLDEVENLRKDNSDAEKNLIDLTYTVQNLEKKISLLERENNQMKIYSSIDKKSKAALDNAVEEYQNQIKSLKQEKQNLNSRRKELEKEREQLKKDLVAKDKDTISLREQRDNLKCELEKSKSAGKQSSVLNLEIEAYEKSLNEVTQKLENQKSVTKELQEAISTKESSIKSLNEQIKLLEESTQSEKLHAQELKQQIDIQQAKMKECEHDKVMLRTQIQDVSAERESLRSEVDELNLQLSRLASDKEKLCSSLQNEKDHLLRQALKLEENLENVTAKLKNSELELEDMRADYASYKVRAQTVLRQNQSKESSRERELEEEMSLLQSTIETLNSKISSLNEVVESHERKSEELQQDNERIQKRCKELMNLLEESRLQNEAILDDTRKQNSQYQESLKSQRLQIETLKNCYKKQIEDLETKHSDEIEELKKKDFRDNKLVSRIAPYGGATKISDEQKIDLILMEREDGEGSESSSVIPKRRISSTNRSRRDLIPLDELLSSSLDDNQNDEDTRSISPTIELQSTKEKLTVQESRVKHLTSLLAEAEQDLAKLTELNELLKEEVRRHERSVEREQHMHNSEYLKNVVIKFLTLSSGDERTRLVPVLNTILKLSPEEANALQNVAKGSDNVNRGWGSYLPIWSNHQ